MPTIHQEDSTLRNSAKDERYSFTIVVLACFFVSAFVFPAPIYADGKIVAWGDNDYGQCDVPSPNTGFTAITAGLGHSLGLKENGSIV
ncbi:MAG: hypothetical protein ACYS71_08590, partial [Planctomycetota bacterium]